MSNLTRHKRGTTFERVVRSRLSAGTWGATSRLELDGKLIAALDCVISVLDTPDVDGNTHETTIGMTGKKTALWPINTLSYDIKFSEEGGAVEASSTAFVAVESEVT